MSHRPENDPDQQLAEVDESVPGSPDVVHSDVSPQASAPPRVDDTNDVRACPRHPNAPVIGGMCGGCTQYPTDMTELFGMVVETDPSIPPGTVELRPATSCSHRGPHPGFTCAEVDQTGPFWAGRWDEMDQSTYERLKQEWTARHANDPRGAAHVLEPPQPQQNTATVTALREQLAEAIGRTNLLIWPRHKRLAAADAVLTLILPATRITAELARNAEADVQRVITLYEQWVKAGAPPLGTSISRWWDQRLAELRHAILGDQAGPGAAPDERWEKLAADRDRLARTLAEANQVMDMQKDFITSLRHIVMTGLGHRQDDGIQFDRCGICRKDHLADLEKAFITVDKTYAEAFPPTADGPARPGRLPETGA